MTTCMFGRKFNRLTVRGYVRKTKSGDAIWECVCDCGNVVQAAGGHLRRGHTQSCGCLQRQRAREANTKHGLTNTKEYSVWCGIKARCYNTNNKRYACYGGRGITLCDEWLHDAKAFREYVRQLPHCGKVGYSLDRIDNDGNYEPGNLRWATSATQTRNNRQTKLTAVQVHTIREKYDNGVRSAELAEMFHVSRQTVLDALAGRTWKKELSRLSNRNENLI